MTGAREVAERLRARVAGRVTVDAGLAELTTFRVGGPADILVEAESEDDLVAVAEVRDGLPVAVVGRGSNLLVSDAGFRGIAVRLGRSFRTHEQTPRGLRLGGAVYLPAVARLTASAGLAGFEFAAEIPATFGGAVRMNAGAHGTSIQDVLVEARCVDLSSGGVRELGVDDLGYRYRHSSLDEQDVVTSGEIRLSRDDPGAVAGRIAAHLKWRRDNQPPGRSAGSVFKNPPGDSAGRLIEQSGGKGMRVGGAEVSEVHANFIVTRPAATAAEVWALIARCRDLVADRTGVVLEREVRLLGEFPNPEPQA